jgi:hypothetical protein
VEHLEEQAIVLGLDVSSPPSHPHGAGSTSYPRILNTEHRRPYSFHSIGNLDVFLSILPTVAAGNRITFMI